MQGRRSIDQEYGLPIERAQELESDFNHDLDSENGSEEKDPKESVERRPKAPPIRISDENGDFQQDGAKIPSNPRIKSDPNFPSGPEVLLIPGDPVEDTRGEPQFAEGPGESLPMGRVEVQANLNPQTEKEPLISSPDQPVKEKVIEAEPLDHLTLEEKADSLPEIIHIPFEDAVKDDVLQGWEDLWISEASYDVKRWGKLDEIKIDFVYLCKLDIAWETSRRVMTNLRRGEWLAGRISEDQISIRTELGAERRRRTLDQLAWR